MGGGGGVLLVGVFFVVVFFLLLFAVAYKGFLQLKFGSVMYTLNQLNLQTVGYREITFSGFNPLNFDMVLMQLNILILSLSEKDPVKENDCRFIGQIKINVNVGMPSDIYALMWFNL